MKNSSRSYFLFIVLVFLGVFVYLWFQANSRLVVFCDVGQGDGILIKDGLIEAVVDAGPDNEKMKNCLNRFLPFFDRKIEFVFASHYDADHIGGFSDIFSAFEVGRVYGLVEVQKKTKTYERWQRELRNLGLKEERLIYGRVIHLNSGYIEVLYPFYDTDYSSRNLSLAMKLHFLDKSFVLSGDLENSHWNDLFKHNVYLGADIFKVSHHGSRNGLSSLLLEKIKPQEAVISVGKNTYGHPHKEVLALLEKNNIRVRRTDKEQDIVYY